MKKILLLLMLVLPVVASAQKFSEITKNMAKAVAADTVIWLENWKLGPWSLSIDYSNFNHDDAQFSIVVSNFEDGAYDLYPTSSNAFPFTLNKTLNAYTDAKGATRATMTWFDLGIIFKRIGIKVKKGTVTVGSFKAQLKQ